MDGIVRKQIGKHKKQSPIKKLQQINKALKKLGCVPKPDNSTTVYRKIIGKK